MTRAVQRIAVCVLCITMLFAGVPFMAMEHEGGQNGSFGVQEVSAASNTVNPGHTEQEIQNYLKSNKISLLRNHSYTKVPVKPNTQGELTAASKQDALKTLNAIRYVAGLDAVTLDNNYGTLQQQVAFVLWNINKLTHYPIRDGNKQPAGMSNTIWKNGDQGASKANIAQWWNANLNQMVAIWMSDADEGNLPRIGHRRWILNPTMGKTGFGATGVSTGQCFFSMHSVDRSHSSGGNSGATNVIWPAQYTPVQFFNIAPKWMPCYDPWSLSTGAVETKSKIKITLTCTAGSQKGNTWKFDGARNYTASNIGMYMNVNNDGAGQIGCIIFRPDGVKQYLPGDTYDVQITGTTKGTISYTVKFINGYPITSLSIPKSAIFEEGESRALKVDVLPAEAQGYVKAEWQSSDESVARVDGNGKVTAVGKGTADITCTIEGKTATCAVNVTERIPFSDNKIVVTAKDITYTGKAEKPPVLVKNQETGEVYVEGVDYVLEWYGNYSTMQSGFEPMVVEPGRGAVYVSTYGCYGKLKGSWGQVDYSVKAKPITADMITVTEKNGKPTLTVKNGSLIMVEGRDYTMTMTNGVLAGTTNVTVKAANTNYTGSATKNVKYTIKDFFAIKGLWVSKHEPSFVTFNWTGRPNNNLATQWEYSYRTKLIGTQYTWSSWTTKKVNGKVLSTRLYLKPNYTIEFKARHADEAGYCRSVFTTPSGGKYQSITQCQVKVTATVSGATFKKGTAAATALKVGTNIKGDSGNVITIGKGQSVKIAPNHVYPRSNFSKYPRLYPNHAWYDVTDSTVASLTGTASTAGMKDGAVTIKGLRTGTTTIKITSCNGRGATLTIVVK